MQLTVTPKHLVFTIIDYGGTFFVATMKEQAVTQAKRRIIKENESWYTFLEKIEILSKF